jgi:hypothetical protein
MLPMTTKACSRGGRRKPLGAFYKQQGGAQSRRGMCKECFRAAERGCLCPEIRRPKGRGGARLRSGAMGFHPLGGALGL